MINNLGQKKPKKYYIKLEMNMDLNFRNKLDLERQHTSSCKLN